MLNRHGSSTAYRYGFQGQEKDDEIKGEGNSCDFGSRVLDPRIGRWFAVDPLAEKFPSMSPYAFCNNNPLYYVDPTGMAPTDWYRNKETGKISWRDGHSQRAGYENLAHTWGSTDVNGNRTLLDGDTKQITYNGVIKADFNKTSTITGDGIRVFGFGGDAVAGSGDMKGDRGSGSIQADMPGDVGMLFEFGQMIGDGINWLLGNDKPAVTGTQSNTATLSTTGTVESTEAVKYRETTGKSSKYGNMNLPDFKVKDTVVPESKASEVYKQLDKKFQNDWQKQVKKDN